jgi:hypothetical protein
MWSSDDQELAASKRRHKLLYRGVEVEWSSDIRKADQREARPARDVTERRPSMLVMPCGFHCTQDEVQQHWAVCFESKGACFFPESFDKEAYNERVRG